LGKIAVVEFYEKRLLPSEVQAACKKDELRFTASQGGICTLP
jgi:hypothetical protein